MATGSFERKSFTGGAAPTTLAANLGAGATSISLADGSTYPTGATNPFVIVINRGTTSEEKILIASRTANVLTVETRGYDDGTDQAHTLGETVEHVLDASTVDQANRYVNLQTTKGDLVVHDGTNPNAVNVGTNGDVLAADSTATNGVAWTNRLTTAESEIDTLQSDMTTAQSDITTLQGTDIDVTLTGDVTGTATITNLGNVSITTTVGDDSHNHVVGNIDDFSEEVQDIVGGMVTGNVEGGVTVTYQDGDGTLDFQVNNPTISLIGDVTGSATMTNLTNVSITTTVGDDTHNHVIANVDGLQNALDGKQPTGSYLTTSTSFAGDVSGTYNAIVVADNSHNHTIANVDGLQTALDGKQATGSYLTTSTSFAGDVSGAYNAIVVADDSHTHDTRYFTESEVTTKLSTKSDTSHGHSNMLTGKRGNGSFYVDGNGYATITHGLGSTPVAAFVQTRSQTTTGAAGGETVISLPITSMTSTTLTFRAYEIDSGSGNTSGNVSTIFDGTPGDLFIVVSWLVLL